MGSELVENRSLFKPITIEEIVIFMMIIIIKHQTHYEKSDWWRAFNQFTSACELDMINAYLLQILQLSCQVQRLPGYLARPLECSPQKQNG